MSSDVAIIDSGGANIASLKCAFDRLGRSAVLTTDPATIRSARRVLLPGVGAARDVMQRLRQNGLVDVIRELEQPVLGICVGMQVLAEASEEEDVDCLGIIPGIVKKLPASTADPVPNMGWCPLERIADHAALRGIDSGDYFYFLHSYALPVGTYTLAAARHARNFSAIVAKQNFIAVQFHPERSATGGARLLDNFLREAA